MTMKRTSLAAPLLLLLAVYVMPVAAQEPLLAGRTEGTVDGATASYTLDATAGQVFVIGASSQDFDPYLRVYGDEAAFNLVSDNDTGAGQNAVVVFTAPAAGAYTVEILAATGNATGAFTVDLIAEFDDLQIGTPLPVLVGDGAVQAYKFESAGGPHDVSVSTGDEIATSLVLIADNNFVVGSDDSSSLNPQLQQVMLPVYRYYVVVQPVDNTLSGTVELLIEASSVSSLNDGPATFTFDSATSEHIVTLDVVAGTLYEIAVTSSGSSRVRLILDAPDPNAPTPAHFSYDKGEGGIFLYRAEVTATMDVQVSGYSNDSGALDVTLTVTEATE